MSKYNRVYLSDREMPLLYMGEPLDKPVITLENYTKWYRIFMVLPTGEVETIDSDAVLATNDKLLVQGWLDHLYHPQLLIRLGKDLNAYTDERALECAGGRWLRENDNLDHLVQRHMVLNFSGEND